MTTLQLLIPEEVGDRVRKAAAEQHISIDELGARALIEKLSITRQNPDLEARARRADWRKFREALAGVPDVPPEEDDRIQ